MNTPKVDTGDIGKYTKHPKCKGHDDVCDYEPITITCCQCKYSSFPSYTDKRFGKDPEAKCNQLFVKDN